LKVLTFNLLNDPTDWAERAPLIVEGLRSLQPDVIALQEVRLPDNHAAWIADRLEGYETYLCRKTGPLRLIEGEALLSRLPVEEHAALAFLRQGRVAHRIRVRTPAGPISICNAHLFFSAFNDVTRRLHVKRLQAWLPEGLPTVVCGDFNAEPGYGSMALMRRRFRSAYAVAHGAEPDYTCPTPLDRGPGFRHGVRRLALRVLGWVLRPGQPSWRGTLDYIYVSPEIQVDHCELVLNAPDPANPSIYPSDHMGLMATLRVQEGSPS
jgi:endonuclease/exonuclease/phosphatase family metal-dependent hydrolase